MRLRLFLALALGLVATSAFADVDRVAVEQSFHVWIDNDLWPDAKAAGVSRGVFDAAFSGIALDWTMPELQPPGAPPTLPSNTAQAEFQTPGAYFGEKNLNVLAVAGAKLLVQWKQTLAAIQKRYGVQPAILVAIWAKETGYGSEKLPKLVIPALATEAFMGLRKDYFRDQLIAALAILQRGGVTSAEMRASWAGAMGQSQIMPSEFLTSAVDFDGDGKIDIWNSVPDSLATTARLIQAQGWQGNRGWGVEASVPAAVACTLEGPEQGKPIATWAKLDVTRVDGRPLPADGGNDYLLMPAGRLGPAFIVTDNFYRLKAYNNSDLYALYIGHLSDRFAHNFPFTGRWSATADFSRSGVKAMQDRLVAAGYDVGKADGLVGFKTRIAVGLWQEKHGEPVTCWPSAKDVQAIR